MARKEIMFPRELPDIMRDGVYGLEADIATLWVDGTALMDNEGTIFTGFYAYGINKQADTKAVFNFLEKYPNTVLSSAYEVDGFILLSRMPDEINNVEGQFNYGSHAIIQTNPKYDRILVQAQND